MSESTPMPVFLTVLLGTVVTGCALMLMVPVLFGVIGEPAPWAGWLTGALALLFLVFGGTLTRLRRNPPPSSPQTSS